LTLRIWYGTIHSIGIHGAITTPTIPVHSYLFLEINVMLLNKFTNKKVKNYFNRVFAINLYLLMLLMFLFSSFKLFANELKTSEVLTFSDAIRKTLQQHPALKPFEHRLKAHAQRVQQATLTTRPEVSLIVEDFAGTSDFTGVKSSQSTLSVSWVLENELIASRLDLATSSEAVILSAQKIKQLELASETAKIFIQALAIQQQMLIINQAIDFSAKTVLEIKKKVSAGKSPQAELLRAEAELSIQDLILEDLKHELQISYRKLSAQWGERSPKFDSLSGAIGISYQPVTFDSLKSQLDKNPEIIKFTSLEQINAAKIRLAVAENKPRWRFMTGLRRYERTDDVAFVAGFTIPFGSKNRSAARVAEIQADISRNTSEVEALKISLETVLFAFHQLMKHNVHLADALNKKIIPKLTEAQTQTYKAYLAGKYAYRDLKIVQDDLINAQLSLLEASLNFHINKIEIETLTGAQLLSNSNKASK